MTEQEAEQVMRTLVVAFSYSEDQFILWRDMLTGLDSQLTAERTARELVRSAETTYCPAWGAFQTIYDRMVARNQTMIDESQRALEDPGSKSFPTVAEGIEIARKAYVAECERQGREPNHALFAEMIDPVARMNRAERRKNSYR